MTKAYTGARRRFLLDQDECEYNRGRAQWLNGYRMAPGHNTDATREQEASHWAAYDRAAKKRDRALAHLIAAVRKEAAK